MPEPLKIPIVVDATQLNELRKALQGIIGDLSQLAKRSDDAGKAAGGAGGDLSHLTSSTIGATRGLSALASTLGGVASIIPGVGSAVMPLQKLGFVLAILRSTSMDINKAAPGASFLVQTLNSIRVPLLIGAGVALGTIIAALKQALSIEEQLVRLQLAAGRGVGMGDLRKMSVELARATHVTVPDAVKAAQSLVKAGVSVKDAFGPAGETVLRFARVAGISVDQAVEILVNVSNQMQVSMETASDAIVRTADISVANITDVSEAFTNAGFAARSLGLDIQSMGAIMAILANAGIRGSQAANSFRRFTIALQEMQAGVLTARQQDIVSKLRLDRTVQALQKGQINAVQFLQELKKVNPQMGQLAAMFDVFGARAAAAILDNIENFQDFYKTIEDAVGATERADERLEKTGTRAFQRLIAVASQFLQVLGDIVALPIVSVFDVFGEVFSGGSGVRFRVNVDEVVTNVRQIVAEQIIVGEMSTEKPRAMSEVEQLLSDQSVWKVAARINRDIARGFMDTAVFSRLGNFLFRLMQKDPKEIAETFAFMLERMSAEQINIVTEMMNLEKGDLFKPLAEAWKEAIRAFDVTKFPALSTPISRMVEQFGLREMFTKRLAEQWAGNIQALGLPVDKEIVMGVARDFVSRVLPEDFLSKSWEEQRLIIERLTSKFGYLDMATAELILAFEDAKKEIVKVVGDLAADLIKSPRDLQSTFGALAEKAMSFVAQKTGEWARDVASTALSGLLQEFAGPVGNIIGALVAGSVISLGNMLVDALVGIFRGPAREIPMRGSEIGYHGGTVVRTGQGLATIPLYSGGTSTYAPSVNIGSINVKGDSDHHKLANRLADVISRRVSQTLEANYWKATLRREGMQEVF